MESLQFLYEDANNKFLIVIEEDHLNLTIPHSFLSKFGEKNGKRVGEYST